MKLASRKGGLLALLLCAALLTVSLVNVCASSAASTPKARHYTRAQLIARLARDIKVSASQKSMATGDKSSMTLNGATKTAVTKRAGQPVEVDTTQASWTNPDNASCWNFELGEYGVPWRVATEDTFAPWVSEVDSNTTVSYSRSEIDKHTGTYKIRFVVSLSGDGKTVVVADEDHRILSVRSPNLSFTFKYAKRLPAAPARTVCPLPPVPGYVTDAFSQTEASADFKAVLGTTTYKAVVTPVTVYAAPPATTTTTTYEVSAKPYEYAAFTGTGSSQKLSTLVTGATRYTLVSKSGCYDTAADNGTAAGSIASVIADAFSNVPYGDFSYSEAPETNYTDVNVDDTTAGVTTIPSRAGYFDINSDGTLGAFDLEDGYGIVDTGATLSYPSSLTFPTAPTNICKT